MVARNGGIHRIKLYPLWLIFLFFAGLVYGRVLAYLDCIFVLIDVLNVLLQFLGGFLCRFVKAVSLPIRTPLPVRGRLVSPRRRRFLLSHFRVDGLLLQFEVSFLDQIRVLEPILTLLA